MNYYYHNRGKCSSCSEIIWTTELFSSIECGCYQGIVNCNNSQSINVQSISDEELITAIMQEYNLDKTEEIVLIKI